MTNLLTYKFHLSNQISVDWRVPTHANVRKQSFISRERKDWQQQQHDDEHSNKNDFHTETDIHIRRLRQPNATDESVVVEVSNVTLNHSDNQAKTEFSGGISLDTATEWLERHQSYNAPFE